MLLAVFFVKRATFRLKSTFGRVQRFFCASTLAPFTFLRSGWSLLMIKNVRLYSVALDDKLRELFHHESELEAAISAMRLKPMSESDISTYGFAPLFGRGAHAYTFSHNGNHFFRFVEENKLLPTSVVNQVLADEVESREEEMGRALKKNEKKALKQAIITKMLAQAFVTRRDLLIWVNSEKGLVGVSVTAAKRAENAITYLRKALGGSFPAKPFQPRCVVEDRMTNFIAKNELPQGFKLGYDAVLKSNDDTGATVRVTKDDLTTAEVISHLKAGKVVTELQLNFSEIATFVLANDLTVKRLSLEDQYLEQNLPKSSGDKIADLQSMILIEGETLTELVTALTRAFDCEVR